MFIRCFYTTDVFQIKRSLTEILDIYLHCLSFCQIRLVSYDLDKFMFSLTVLMIMLLL